ncbi:MAG TPA: PhnD/SsuA/transferrin family substrate-binding protein [Ktedonobacteraceae bacterium]|jgi:phosphonate transport system substrate-binding protein|nr:PhnD/SsuA/transferrin family substrate-binding protein [Ktedonobacteraceae bacterium]
MRQRSQTDATIRFATLLSPVLYETYDYIVRYVGERLGIATTLCTDCSLQEIVADQVDISFLCGLLYVRTTSAPSCPLELLAAPVLQGARYQDAPIYFSDVLVRKDSPYASFDDLEGCVWAYNERVSHSGYNLVCYSLLERDKTPNYFRKMIASGAHLRSLQMVLDGRADAMALDSHVLDVLRAQQPELAAKLRVIDILGPSSIPPLVVSKRLDATLKREIQTVLLSMHADPHAARELSKGKIQRFVAVTDEHYDDIRDMLARVEAVVFPF